MNRTPSYMPSRISEEVLKSAKRMSKRDLAKPDAPQLHGEIIFRANRQGICLVCLGLSELGQVLAWVPQTRIARHVGCVSAGLHLELYDVWQADQDRSRLAKEYKAIKVVMNLLARPRHHRLHDRVIKILQGYQAMSAEAEAQADEEAEPALRLIQGGAPEHSQET